MLPHVMNLFFIALNFVPHFAELLKAVPPADWYRQVMERCLTSVEPERWARLRPDGYRNKIRHKIKPPASLEPVAVMNIKLTGRT